MLLPCSAEALDATEIDALLLQSDQKQINCFKPHGNGGVDLMLGSVDMDAFLHAIAGQIAVEFNFGIKGNLEVGCDGNSYGTSVQATRSQPDPRNRNGSNLSIAEWIGRSQGRGRSR